MKFFTLAYMVLGGAIGLAAGMWLPIGKVPSPTTMTTGFGLIAIMTIVSLAFISLARYKEED